MWTMTPKSLSESSRLFTIFEARAFCQITSACRMMRLADGSIQTCANQRVSQVPSRPSITRKARPSHGSNTRPRNTYLKSGRWRQFYKTMESSFTCSNLSASDTLCTRTSSKLSLSHLPAKNKTGRASQPTPFLTALFFRRFQARSKRSPFITLVHAATKSFANFSLESAHPYTSAKARKCECEPKIRSTRVPVHLTSFVFRSRPS